MIRRLIVGLLYCIFLYFVALFVVGVVAGRLATVAPGQDEMVARNDAARAEVTRDRPIIMFAVVGFVFFGTRSGILPGTRAERSPLLRR